METSAPTELVDPFLGTGPTEFPPKQGLAATWFFPKAQTGNTHPGACLPFGMVSACAYSGAYVTGYGTNGLNTHGHPPQMFDKLTASGFSHLHQSGTGTIGCYYNYFRVTPRPAPDTPMDSRHALAEEVASPGYYAATLEDCGIRAELTVTPCGAIHRYTFHAEGKPHIAIDFAAGGLPAIERPTRPSSAGLAVSGNGFEGHVVMEGIPLYVCGKLRQKAGATRVFVGAQSCSERSVSFGDGAELPESLGVDLALDPTAGRTGELFLAFSLTDIAQARKNLASFEGQSFDEARLAAETVWADHLGRILVQGEQTERRLFYSALYHSLLKPCHLNGESPFYENGHPFYADFATLWDQYKTVFPLIFTLFPETGSRMVNSLLATSDCVGSFPNAVLLSRDMTRCAAQARGLAQHVLADARTRHLGGIAWRGALDRMIADLERDANTDFHDKGVAEPFTHTLDLAAAYFCTALVAAAEGNPALRDRAWQWTPYWKHVYDTDTGILGESKYYEGGAWNYSFRLLHDMAARIALHGGDGPFVKTLERFFGYGAPPARQQVDPADGECRIRGFALNRFEGFNNEPDMETPYAFVYAGRHDRTCEVVRAGMRHQFFPGRGGLPGNNDSGGLTSAYCWNAAGLFPVAGQPHMLIGSPVFESVRLALPGAELNIHAARTSARNIYVGSATFNGKPIHRAYLTMAEFLRGGELVLRMSDEPTGWAKDERPPSYTDPEQLSRGEF